MSMSKNLKPIISKYFRRQGYVGQNLDRMKIFIFTSTRVSNICLQSKATPKECLELKTLSGLAPKFQIVTGATKKTKCMQFPRLKKKSHILLTTEDDRQQCTPFMRTCTPIIIGS